MSDETTERKPFIDLSLTQLIGSSAAAITAAALGSRLGTVGTIIGAGFASIISAIAGAVYTSSLRRTQELIRTKDLKVRTGQTATQPAPPRRVPAPESAVEKDGEPEETLQPDEDTLSEEGPETADTEPPAWRRLGWKTVAVTAAVVFAVTALVITGTELLTGKSLSGSHGTTVSNVVHHGSSKKGSPTPTPSPTPSGTGGPSTSPSSSSSQSAAPPPPPPTTSSTPTGTPTSGGSSSPTPGSGTSGAADPATSGTPTSSPTP